MLRGSLMLMAVLGTVTGCAGGGPIGSTCGGNDDCAGSLQCLNARCQPRCVRAPDCGDGYACSEDGLCIVATRQPGDACQSEVDCAVGLSCQLDNYANADLHQLATCNSTNATAPAGSTCSDNADCRNGTCALGHCVDLCKSDLDCGDGYSCHAVPSVSLSRAIYYGCLPQAGLLSWTLPTNTTTPELLVPVPSGATSLSLLMTVDDPNQKVGATSILAPNGTRVYARPCSAVRGDCSVETETNQFYDNAQRHEPGVGQSVLQIPSGNNVPLGVGVYQIEVASQRVLDNPGTAVPRVTAVVRLDTGVRLELHLFFLDLTDHPCQAAIGAGPLDAAAAQRPDGPVQNILLPELHDIFQRAALSVSAVSYEDIKNRPALDAIDLDSVGDLLKLGKHATGVNVFFVRSLSPAGVQAYAPNPGPGGIGGTRQSGIVISMDTLCYRSWPQIARLTAHELARYLGLYHNVELGTDEHASWVDQIDDTDANVNNLMYFAEHLGSDAEIPMPTLSAHQREILTRHPAMLGVQVKP